MNRGSLTKKEIYGTNIPSATAVKQYEDEQAKRRIYDAAVAGGVSEADATAAAEGSGFGSSTPRLDKMAYDEEQRQKRLASTGIETPRVRADLSVRQLIRRFKGQAPLAETPLQFAAQIETSKGYGGESALLTPAGKMRATESAIAAGLSPAEAQAQINAASASLLKDVSEKARITKGLSEPLAPSISTAGLTPTSKPTPAATEIPETTPVKPTKTTDTAPAVKTVVEAPEIISGAPESEIGKAAAIGTVGSVVLKSGLDVGAKAAETAAADAAKKALEKTVAGGAIDAAAETALKGSAELTEAAKIAKQQALAAERMSKVAQGLTTPVEVATNVDELKRLRDVATGRVEPVNYIKNAKLAKERANAAVAAAKKAEAALEGTVMGLAGKSGDIAVEAANISARSGKLAKTGEALRKISGSKVVKGLGKASGILELASMGIEAGSLATDENLRKQRIAELEQAASGSSTLSGKGAAQGFFNPVGTLYAAGAIAGQALESGAAAKKAEAALGKAEQEFNKRLETRRNIVSDEDFQKLAQKERSAIMAAVRKATK